jgi:hypothetical protein
MRVAFLLATLLTTSAPAFAGAIGVTSPDRARTFAYGEVIWHQLYLEQPRGELAARITFSNRPYACSEEPRTDEAFDFRFRGIQVDLARRGFFARRHGEVIPVARFRGDPACGCIDLAPGAKIYLLKESGRVTAILTATSFPRGGMRWIEMDNNYSLQNLLVALLGEIGVRPNVNLRY